LPLWEIMKHELWPPLYAKLCRLLDCSPVRARSRRYFEKNHRLPHSSLWGT
jgi:hypothetical protein